MAYDSTLNAAYLIVDYAWEALKANHGDIWDESKYDGIVPIVPLGQEPELQAMGGPYIVYGYAESGTGDLYAQNEASVTFAVYDQNFRRMTKTMNVLKGIFERQDESARDINAFTSVYQDGMYLGIRFGTVSVGFVEGGTPEETEGGRESGLINITYTYYQENTLLTKFE